MDCSPPGSPVHGYSPGKSTGVGCHFLLQGIFPTQGSNLGLLHCRRILYHLSCQGWLNSVPCQLCAHYTSVSSDLGAVLGTLPTLTVNLPGTIQDLVPTQQMKGRLNNLPRVIQVWPKSVALQTYTFFASCHKKTFFDEEELPKGSLTLCLERVSGLSVQPTPPITVSLTSLTPPFSPSLSSRATGPLADYWLNVVGAIPLEGCSDSRANCLNKLNPVTPRTLFQWISGSLSTLPYLFQMSFYQRHFWPPYWSQLSDFHLLKS